MREDQESLLVSFEFEEVTVVELDAPFRPADDHVRAQREMLRPLPAWRSG
jgi:hypothetical protein